MRERFLALGCVLLATACGSKGDALVVVTVSSATSLTGIVKLHASATAKGKTGQFDITPAAALSIPPSQTFGVQVPEALTGVFTITVDALNATAVVASGSVATTTSAGKRSDVEIDLAAPGSDMGAGDGGADACAPQTCQQAGFGCGSFTSCGMTVDCGPCLLAAVTPSFANTGDPLRLEGSFGPATQIVFPGGTAVDATLLGPNRATVKVPATATAGLMGMTVSGGNVLSKVPFRRANFTIGLQAFSQTYEQTDAARLPPVPNVQRSGSMVATAGRTVLLMGGGRDSGGSGVPEPTTEQAMINADGTLSDFVTLDATRSLATPRASAAVFQSSSYLYLIGGWDNGSNVYKVVERTRLQTNNIDPFTVDAIALNTGRFSPASAIVGAYFYVLGGGTQGPLSNIKGTKTIERAAVKVDGSLGPFENVTGTTLLKARVGAAALVIADRLYVFGGADGDTGTFLKTVESAPIAPDGNLGAFADTGITLSVDRLPAGAFLVGGRVYLLGGVSTSNGTTTPQVLASIDSAAVDNKGVVGAFSPYASSMVATRYSPPIIVGNYLTFVDSGGGQPGAERASLADSGAVTMFTDNGHPLAGGRSSAGTAVIGNFVYQFGGHGAAGGLDGIARAPVTDDGVLGPFSAMGLPALSTPRIGPAVAVLGHNVYVIGGKTAGGGITAMATIDAFNIGSDNMGNDTLTSIPAPPPMGTKRADFQVVAVEAPNHTSATLYAIGGNGPVAGTSERIVVTDNHGALDPNGWSPSPSPAPSDLATSRAGVMVGQTYYLVGGQDSTSNAALATVAAATVNNGALGNFAPAPTLSLQHERYDGSLLVLGNGLVIVAGLGTNVDMGQPLVGAVDSAPLVNNGMPLLQTFSTLAASGLSTPCTSASGVVLGNNAYLIGGLNSSGDLVTVQRAQLQ